MTSVSANVELSSPWMDGKAALKQDNLKHHGQAIMASSTAGAAAGAAAALPPEAATHKSQPVQQIYTSPGEQEYHSAADVGMQSRTIEAAAAPAGKESPKAAAICSFEEICNTGSKWTWANWAVKLQRYAFLWIKEIYLLPMTLSLPTNHLMLTFRTLPRDFAEPHSNSDHLAAKFRNAVMPARGRLHDNKSSLIKINRWFIELPLVAIPGIVRFIDVRTQWFDEGVSSAIRDGIKQVVIIAAGYDTRAYRLARPGVRFYELDLPHASRRKQELVRDLLPAAQYSRPEFVAADLSKVKLADALAGTSFDPQQPTIFTAEGLIYYLPPAAVQQLLTCISTISAPGSRVMLDFLHLDTLAGNVWHPGFETLMLAVQNKGETMYSGIDHRSEKVDELVRQFGLQTRELLHVRDMVKRYMPHKDYRADPPTVSPYFSYLSAEAV